MSVARIEWGYAEGSHTLWCAKRVTSNVWMLCRRRKGWMPPVPYPFDPPNVCPDCARILAAHPDGFAPQVDEQAEGTCPVCVGRAPVGEDGLIAEHRQWSWSDGRLVLTGEMCAGAGERPEYES